MTWISLGPREQSGLQLGSYSKAQHDPSPFWKSHMQKGFWKSHMQKGYRASPLEPRMVGAHGKSREVWVPLDSPTRWAESRQAA